ncbi:MAG: efflux RND transporter periplasmic adaptor subunit [Pirellulaceae bacterium]
MRKSHCCQHTSRKGKIVGRVVVGLLVVAAAAGVYFLAPRLFGNSGKNSDESLTYTVQRRSIFDSVVERGTIESQNTVNGRCELPGWENKIIFIVPEGTTVQEGDMVVRFDSAEIDRMIQEKKSRLIETEGKLEQAKQDLEVQKNKNESDIAAAELDLQLAELDLDKYVNGDYLASKADMERNMSEGDAELKKVSDELANMRTLVRKGFRSPEQLRELELRVRSAQSRVDRDKQQYRVLIDFDHKRKITEYEAKAKESERKLERAKTTAEAELRKAESAIASAENDVELVQEELEEYEEYKSFCEIKAPQAGTVAYANKEWYDPNERIREGATVRRQQDIFYLPDMSKLQVKVNVHESVINKIKNDLKCSIRVDAYPDTPLDGHINFVASLATSSFGTSKNYEVIVLIDQLPEGITVKPGMTAEVEMMIGVYDNVLAVPVSAVTEHFQLSYCYRKNVTGAERIVVVPDRTTHSFIEIKEGLQDGDVVYLDAYQRGLSDFAEAERAASQDGGPAPGNPEPTPSPDE